MTNPRLTSPDVRPEFKDHLLCGRTSVTLGGVLIVALRAGLKIERFTGKKRMNLLMPVSALLLLDGLMMRRRVVSSFCAAHE